MFHSSRTQILQKSTSHLIKILGTRKVTHSQFHTEDPQTTEATVQNFLYRVNPRPGSVKLRSKRNTLHIVMVRRTKFQSSISEEKISISTGPHSKLQSLWSQKVNFSLHGPNSTQKFLWRGKLSTVDPWNLGHVTHMGDMESIQSFDRKIWKAGTLQAFGIKKNNTKLDFKNLGWNSDERIHLVLIRDR